MLVCRHACSSACLFVCQHASLLVSVLAGWHAHRSACSLLVVAMVLHVVRSRPTSLAARAGWHAGLSACLLVGMHAWLSACLLAHWHACWVACSQVGVLALGRSHGSSCHKKQAYIPRSEGWLACLFVSMLAHWHACLVIGMPPCSSACLLGGVLTGWRARSWS